MQERERQIKKARKYELLTHHILTSEPSMFSLQRKGKCFGVFNLV